MRCPRLVFVAVCLVIAACAKNGEKAKPTCGSGLSPEDPMCNLPQCSDGIDNDGDGLIDLPNDPGCTSPNQDTETDDCPDGPNCPECGNGKDDDGNGLIDFSGMDPGCQSAADPDEYTDNPYACGNSVMIQPRPADNHITGMFMSGAASQLTGSCGGLGSEVVYEIRLHEAKVMVATTDTGNTTADTVLYIRGANCSDASSELACNDNVSSTDLASTVTAALPIGTSYLVVDSHDTSVSGMYDLQITFYPGEGAPCTGMPMDCGPGLVCRVPMGGTAMVCSQPECNDGVDNDGDGKIDYPNDPGCDTPADNDETDDCPTGPMCPQCGNGKDDDGDGKIDYPADPQCHSASGTSEACSSTEPVAAIVAPVTMGNTSSATDDFLLACAFGTGGRDLTYQLTLPKTTTLSINVVDPTDNFFPDYELLGATCGGTARSTRSPRPTSPPGRTTSSSTVTTLARTARSRSRCRARSRPARAARARSRRRAR